MRREDEAHRGGNSGGPTIVEGTRHAIGLPYTHAPEDFQRRGAEDLASASHVALMADFAAEHQEALTAEGITIVPTLTAQAFDSFNGEDGSGKEKKGKK